MDRVKEAYAADASHLPLLGEGAKAEREEQKRLSNRFHMVLPGDG